ncbi:galectin-4-like [Festucalex cinctus]
MKNMYVVRDQKRCARAQTWQLVFLAFVLIVVTLFSLYSLISVKKTINQTTNQGEPQKFPKWVINANYVPVSADDKILSYSEQLALDLVNKMAASGKIVAQKVNVSSSNVSRSAGNDKSKISCWRTLDMKPDEEGVIGELAGRLRVAHNIVVRGRVNEKPKSFKVQLLMGKNHGVALHLNPRFNESGDRNVFVRNSHLAGSWGLEERQQLGDFPFAPNIYFEMIIRCDAGSFNVSVLSVDLNYKYRASLDMITHVRVHGDMTLIDVKHM